MFWRSWIDGIAGPVFFPKASEEGFASVSSPEELGPLWNQRLCDPQTHAAFTLPNCHCLEPRLTPTSSQDSSRVSTAASGLQFTMQHGLDFNLQRPSVSTVLALQVSTTTSGEGPDVDAGCLVLISALRFCLCFSHYSLVSLFFYVMQDTEPRALSMLRKCL